MEVINEILHEFDLPITNPVLVFSLILFIILLSPILLRKLRIPGIIGLIISGVIIGPFGMNILEKNSAITLFSTIGLLYIMFMAGLDLDLQEFKQNRNKSLVFGILTFILPLLIGFPTCYFLLDYGFNASLLTAGMFSTHTLVAYPIVSKFGLTKNQSVAVTVGGTILTDTLVLIMLAVIVGNNTGELNADFWAKLGFSISIFSVIMFFFIPHITKWFFKKLESEKYAHYIFILSVVFLSAFLAELTGLEPIIGAFVAGIVLNPLIPKSSALMNRIEFIGNALFIPFFLISVGMLVDLRVVLSGTQALIIAGSLTLVALFGKWLAAYITQKFYGFTVAQRKLIFGLSSSHAAATLAIILVGYNTGILDENILNGTIILILVTCVVASFLVEKASKEILLSSRSSDSSSASDIIKLHSEHILLPIANQSNISKLLEFATFIKDRKSANPITILSVVPDDASAEANILSAQKILNELAVLSSGSETRVNTIATLDHNPVSGISRVAREIMADKIIIGWPQKSGFIDIILGEFVQKLLKNIDKNIFISHFNGSLISNKRIILFTAPNAEKEMGFEKCISVILRLSKELNINLVHVGSMATFIELKRKMKFKYPYILATQVENSSFDTIQNIFIKIEESDILVFMLARENAVSYQANFDILPKEIEKIYSSHNKMIIYPQSFSQV